jgi:nitrogen-specific signal transduction histidine kinase
MAADGVRAMTLGGAPLDPLQLLNALPQPMLAIDAAGAIREVNTAAEHFFESGRSTLLRARLVDIMPFGSPVIGLVADAISARATVNGYKLDVSTPRTGLGRVVDAFVSPLPRPEDGVVLLLQERSIAEKMDRQLTHRSAARSVTALGAMLAHEIKNPLSGIRGAAQLLEASASDEDRALTRLICDETDRIVKLVDRMESFSDERPHQRESLNIHRVLDHVKRLAQAGFGHHIRFTEVYDPSLPHVFGSRDALIQVFLNLVKNAAEAIGEESIDGLPPGRAAEGRRRRRANQSAAGNLHSRQRPGRSARHRQQPVRAVRQLQVRRVWPGTCTCCQGDRRPWRNHRIRVASAPHHVSRADAVRGSARRRRRRRGIGQGGAERASPAS